MKEKGDGWIKRMTERKWKRDRTRILQGLNVMLTFMQKKRETVWVYIMFMNPNEKDRLCAHTHTHTVVFTLTHTHKLRAHGSKP